MNFIEFVTESNRIEGILRPPTEEEVNATRAFVCGESAPNLDSVARLAYLYAGKRGLLRNQRGMDVRVGSHIAPRGGPRIYAELDALLRTIEESDPFEFHVAYETLHPFMDGNGRTGRALWAWQVMRLTPEYLDLGFLHAWYYQTLSAQRRDTKTSEASNDLADGDGGSLQPLPDSESGSSVSSSGDDWIEEANELVRQWRLSRRGPVGAGHEPLTKLIAALCVRAAGTNEVEAALKELRELFPLLTHSILIHDSKRRAEVIISCGGIQQSRGYTLVEAMACVRAEKKGKQNSGAPKP